MPPVKKIGETIGIIYPATEDGSWIKSSIKIILSSNCITSISLYYEAKDGGTAVFDCESSTVCTFARRLRRRRDDVLLTFPMEEEGFNMYGIMGNYELRFLECIKSMIKYENIEKDFIPGSRGVMAFPYIAGEGSFYCCDMRGGIIGIEGSPSDIISAIYEAIGYSLRERLECFSHCGIDIDTIIAVPGINDRGFYQILSDITSRDILTGDKNMDCLGCTYNIINNRTLDKSTLGPKIIPNRENTDLYRCLSNLHKGAYNSLNDIYRYRRKLLK
jgi:sugar (pentulose or hexulose) kinase